MLPQLVKALVAFSPGFPDGTGDPAVFVCVLIVKEQEVDIG